MSNKLELTLKDVQAAVSGTAAAFRSITELEPAGGKGDKIFPPTYEGGKYATEKRVLPDEPEPVDCVLLDSVQSQANRMELALLQSWREGLLPLPVITVDFDGNGLSKSIKVTSLEAPHRVADALLRDSLLGDVQFRQSEVGKRLDNMNTNNATTLFELCPTALIFGVWDSTGLKGGAGPKFARAMVSEIVGTHAVVGVKTSSRIDPAQILKEAGPLYETKNGGWTLDKNEARKEKNAPKKFGKNGRPSEVMHGNITPTIADGGVTVNKINKVTVVSLPALRRLSFPINGAVSVEVNQKARTVLASLALCAATLSEEQGCDLRSRCLLRPITAPVWEIIDSPKEETKKYTITSSIALSVYKEAVNQAKGVGLPFREEELVLKPMPQLVELVRKSQELAASSGVDVEEGE